MIKTTLLWNDPVKAPVKVGQNIGTININIVGNSSAGIDGLAK